MEGGAALLQGFTPPLAISLFAISLYMAIALSEKS